MLHQRMEQSWPMYKKCVLETKRTVAGAKYVAHPYTLPGKRATPSAMEKADLVNRALTQGFQPDRFSDEDEINGMIFDLCEAIPMGISIVELMWNEDATDPAGQSESLIRASAWVNPRNYTFTPDGRIGIQSSGDEVNIGFRNPYRPGQVFNNPDKYIVAKAKTKSGSPLTAGLMRTLADIWTIVAYGRDFARLYMQKYGNPFLALSYDAGITDQNMISQFERLAQQAANQGWIVYPKGSDNTNIEIKPAQSMGGDNAQIAMMRIADEACQLLFLGQTLTTDVGDSGSRALGDVHNSVRTEIIEAHAKWIARILTYQFADSLLRVNYGKAYLANPERPTVEPDLTRPMTATEQGEYLSKISASKVPMIAEPVYKRMGMEMPQPGDTILNGTGELVIMEDAVTPTEKRQIIFDEQLDQQVSVNTAMGNTDEPVEQTVAKAGEQDRLELENLVAAAEASPHRNGELKLVQAKLKEIANKTRT